MCLFDLDCSAVFSGISHYIGMISPAYKVLKCRKGILPQFADYWFRFVFVDRKFKSYAKNQIQNSPSPDLDVQVLLEHFLKLNKAVEK